MPFRYTFRLAWLVLPALLGSCTATEQTAENAAPRSQPLPTQVSSDADRRALYESNGTNTQAGAPVPDATPNVMRLGENAADINRRKRPETINTNDPNLTTPETRLQRIDQVAADTLRRP